MHVMRVLALVSGGKDSSYAMVQAVAAGHQIVALANLRPKDRGGMHEQAGEYFHQEVN